jgi:hypothetical protein
MGKLCGAFVTAKMMLQAQDTDIAQQFWEGRRGYKKGFQAILQRDFSRFS